MVKKRKQYFNLKRTLLLKKLVAFLLIITFAAACGESIPHETDMRTIQLEFFDAKTQSKPLRMDIPFAYLPKDWRHTAKHKPQPYQVQPSNVVKLKAIFPELTPHPQKFYQTGKTKQGLYIRIMQGDFTDKVFTRTLASYKKKYRLRDTDFHGLHRYEIECFKQKCSGDQYYYLILESDSLNKKIFGKCNKPELKHGDGCAFSSEYRGKVFNYIFRRTELPKWREIDAHVHTLLDSFVVEEHDQEQSK